MNKNIVYSFLIIGFAYIHTAENNKNAQLTKNLEALAKYKEGMSYLKLIAKDGLENAQQEKLAQDALDAFNQAEELNPTLFGPHYQRALIFFEGKIVPKDLERAKKYLDKAIVYAVAGSEDFKKAKELKELIETDKKIIAGKRIEAQDWAQRGFEKLKQFESPHDGQSTEGLDKDALLFLGKSSVLDNTNFEIEYQLAKMYLNGIGTKQDFVVAKTHAKRALEIAKQQNSAILSADAKKLIDLIVIKSLDGQDTQDEAGTSKKESRKSRALSFFGGDKNNDTSSEDSAEKNKRKSLLDMLNK